MCKFWLFGKAKIFLLKSLLSFTKRKNMESTNKKVGVVIPIYNVEKYLRDCLDSVLNQDYKNYEVLMVNDGSKDSSFDIAMEYVKKYPQFRLIDKPNCGLSSSRNVGIEYFSHDYTFIQDCIESNITSYTITSSNKYSIKALYTNNKASSIEDIDYIIFLDSDDFWEKNCLSECIKYSDGVDIVWFRYNPYCDGIKKEDVPKWVFEYENLHKMGYGTITRDEWMRRCSELKLVSFFFAWVGLINFNFLKSINLKFIDGIIYEDHYFGILLFFHAKYIYVLDSTPYNYRIRPNSIISYEGEQNITESSIPASNKDIYAAFNNNARLAKQYYMSYSYFITMLEFDKFFKTCTDSKIKEFVVDKFFPYYLGIVAQIFNMKKDPRHIIEQMPKLAEYKDKTRDRRLKAAMKSASYYRKIKPLLTLYRGITYIERGVRKLLKKKRDSK